MTEINKMNPYKVLARKYRPETFKDLVGQAAMVQTLRNAFEADRIAQAFILTGIRGTENDHSKNNCQRVKLYRSRSKRWAHSRALREMFKLCCNY